MASDVPPDPGIFADELWLRARGKLRVEESVDEGEAATRVWKVSWLESQERYKDRALREQSPTEPLEFHRQASTREAAIKAVRKRVDRA